MIAADRAIGLLGPLAEGPGVALVTGMVAATEGPWAIGVDPGIAAYLAPAVAPPDWFAWLATICGARYSAAYSEAQQRAELANPSGWGRGTRAAVIATATVWLSATQSVVVEERTAADGTPDPYHFVLIVRPEEVTDVDALTSAVTAETPAGIFWTLVQVDAPLLSQYTRLLSAVTVKLSAASYADVT